MKPQSTSMTQHLYEQILGVSWAELPESTRFLHSPAPVCELCGHADIQRGGNALAELLASTLGLPLAGTAVPTRVRVTARDGGELLERWYAGQRFATWQWVKDSLLLEQFGPFTLAFALTGSEAGIAFQLYRVRLWGMPLPKGLRPHITASERSKSGAHLFDVELRLPLVGRIVRYAGSLRPAD